MAGKLAAVSRTFVVLVEPVAGKLAAVSRTFALVVPGELVRKFVAEILGEILERRLEIFASFQRIGCIYREVGKMEYEFWLKI